MAQGNAKIKELGDKIEKYEVEFGKAKEALKLQVSSLESKAKEYEK